MNSTFTEHLRADCREMVGKFCWLTKQYGWTNTGCTYEGEKHAFQLYCFSEDGIHQEFLHLSRLRCFLLCISLA